MPMGTHDVVEFSRDEKPKLITLLFATTVFGLSVQDDLYVVPDHARYILKTDHHGTIDVNFRTSDRLQAFVAGMNEKEFPLPDELPDWTFKLPPWMKKGPNRRRWNLLSRLLHGFRRERDNRQP